MTLVMTIANKLQPACGHSACRAGCITSSVLHFTYAARSLTETKDISDQHTDSNGSHRVAAGDEYPH